MHKVSLVALVAGALTSFATVAEAQTARDVYNGGAPLTVDSLPGGKLKTRLQTLSPQARGAALDKLNTLNVPANDLDSIEVDPTGGIFYVDPGVAGPRGDATEEAPPIGRAIIAMTPAKVFTLHSKPGAKNVVYLNFKGARVSGTAWNQGSGVAVHDMLPYDKDGDPSRFSADEVNEMAEIWRIMSEDYAPFDIDVTTEKPKAFGPRVGHVLFSPRMDKNGNYIFSAAAGGVAYVGVWGNSDFTTYQPALVFPEGLGKTSKYMAEAGSHELGHNMGLGHDGTSTEGYYGGHGSGNVSWGPLMGVGYYANISQWSQGEYPDANNKQDDLALIAGKLGYVKDDHGNTTATATPLKVTNGKVSSISPVENPWNYGKVNRGVITNRRDVDYFSFATSGGNVSLTIRPDWVDTFRTLTLRADNLDVSATLYNAAGKVVATSNPKADTFAEISARLPRGKYYLEIGGVGLNPLATGYSDYGSLGQYFIDGTVPGG